jgi:hypothetical protein
MTGFGALAAGGVAWCEDGEVVDLSALGDVFAQPTLNALLAAGRPAWEEAVTAARAHDGPRVPESEARVRLPFEVAHDGAFDSSLENECHVGRRFMS